jgi:hypothetical protein
VGSIWAVSPGVLVLAGAIATVIGARLPWLQTMGPFGRMVQVGTDMGGNPMWMEVRRWSLSLFYPNGLAIQLVAGIAGVIAIAILLRRLVLVAGGLVLVAGVVVGWMVDSDYSIFVFYAGMFGPGVMAVGIGPYVAAAGVMVWAMGGLLAIAGGLGSRQELTVLGWVHAFGSAAGRWTDAIPLRQRRAIVLVSLSATATLAAGVLYMHPPSS